MKLVRGDLPMPSLDRWPRLQLVALRLRYALAQLLERRLWLFAIADVLVVLSGILEAAVAGAGVEVVYFRAVLLPSLVLGLPTLAGVVAVDRRSGGLELALATVSTERFFLRRALPVVLLLVAQSAVMLTLAHLESAGGLEGALVKTTLLVDYLRCLLHTVLLEAWLGALVLFWAVRLESSGAVAVAGALTALAFLPWLTAPLPREGMSERLLSVSMHTFAWAGGVLVLSLATLILYLYARERLRRPESMLA